LLGYEPGEIEPSTSTFRQLLHPDDLQRMLEAVKSHFEQDVRYDVEYRLRTKSGKYRWFRARAAVLRNEIGQPVRMTGCIEDIEDRKRAEEELRIKDHAIHSAITGVAFCDLEGTISYANPAFAKMFGYDHAGEVVGLMKTELVSVESSMIDIISIVKARGFWQGENIGKKKDDTLFPIELAVSLINDADGKPLGMVGTFLDISRRRQAERLASIGTLAAGIAHEINNPLGAMLLTAEYALGKLDDRTVIEDSLENILSQIDRCAQVVRSVLQFSRDGYSKKSRHDLIEVLRRAIDLSRQQVQQAGVQIDLETNLRECFVALNPLEIEQVFVNLIVNAVQSSNRGDRVVVKLEHDNNRARVVVEDQGAGMPAEIRARVFDPFFSTRLHSGGTGLGLSIVHGIVRDHDGNIDVWSEPDRGTRMTVTLPTVQPRQFDAQSACC
jgi:PAS domain S-box-containing protein